MNKKFSKAILTCTVVGSFLGYTALPSYADYQQVIASYDNFAKTAGLTLNKGTATSNPNGVGASVDGQNVLRLVTSARWQVGTAFLTNKVSLAGLKSFSSDFTFQIRDEYPLGAGADGLTFVIQSTANNFVGWYGGDLGYSGLTNSVGLEFDTHINTQYNDPNDNHVGLDLNGNLTSVKTANPPGRLSTGIWHAWVDYTFASQQLQLRLSQDSNRPMTPLLSETVPLTSILGSDQAFIGFTSATGERWANHDLLSFHMKSVVQQNIAHIGVNATQPKLGETTSTVTATLTDDNNRPVPNEKVAFTTSLGEITGYGITDENGVATATLTDKVEGTATVTATAANGLAGSTNVAFTFPAAIDATVTADPSILWSPDHKMATINTKVNATSPAGIESIVLTSITSNQADNGSGDGNTTADIQGAVFGTYDTQFQLRAERDGGTPSDRVYTITYTITDKLGHTAIATCTVTVPHNKNLDLTDESLVDPTQQPTDTTDPTAPVTDQTTTTTDESAPTTDQSAPTTDQPAPTTDQPAPTTDQSAPTTDQPAPTTDQPAPTADQSAPTTDQPAPTTDQPAPTTDQSAPTTDQSAPTTN